MSDDCIEYIIPAANGFTVVYNANATALELSTATVEKIELPSDLKTQWIYVHWINIEDQRRDNQENLDRLAPLIIVEQDVI